jgi:transcription initiation factor TFIID TATA-box-binding protein
MSTVPATLNFENIVASISLQQSIDLHAIVKAFPAVEYRPNRFPGLVFRPKKSKTAMLIFSTGKMVCTGARSERQVHLVVHGAVRELQEKGIRARVETNRSLQS